MMPPPPAPSARKQGAGRSRSPEDRFQGDPLPLLLARRLFPCALTKPQGDVMKSVG